MYGENKYDPASDVHLDVGDPNQTENFNFSLFDYDVSIIHIEQPRHHTIGYYQNIPKISEDANIALVSGRTVICIPDSKNFTPKSGNNYGDNAYDWTKNFQINLRDNYGHDIRPSGSGLSQRIKNYLKYCSEYHQIALTPKYEEVHTLAVVGDTDIVVGMEQHIGRGVFVILPPPNIQRETYQEIMFHIVQLARKYFEQSQRRIRVQDTPDWLSDYLVDHAIVLRDKIIKLNEEKTNYDLIDYMIY